MKRIFAIVLLTVHLFNLGGYALLFQYYIHEADVQMVKTVFDNKLGDEKLVEIRIPVNMPTIQDWDDYAVVAGQIQLKDAYYNYTRLKMTRDTLYFLCFPNTTKTRLANANIFVVKELSDAPLNKKSQDPLAKKINAVSNYTLQVFQFAFSAFGIMVKQNNKPQATHWDNPFIESPGKPPNFCC